MQIFVKKLRYPDTMKEEGEAFFGQAFPLAKGVCDGSGGLKAQFPLVEELRGQYQQGLVGTVVVDQLRHLSSKKHVGRA